MEYFALKISDPQAVELVDEIKEESQDFVVQQLNQLEDRLAPGCKVFMQLGGDRVPWDKGLIGLAEIIRAPYDKGYDPDSARNFRLGLKMVLTMSNVIKREEFRYYVDAYDAGGIGPNTKGEQNQAIKSLTEKQAFAILRAMVEKENNLEAKIRENFNEYECEGIFGKMSCMIEQMMTFEEEVAFRRNQGNNDSSLSETLMAMSNSEFIFALLNILKENELFSDEVIDILTDKEACANRFKHNNMGGIILKKDDSVPDQRKDEGGHDRYYSDEYIINGDAYYVSSQWRSDRDDARRPIIEWVEELVETKGYWPSPAEYNPSVDEETWVDILLSDKEEYPATLEMLKTMLDLGGESTCKKLSEVLGEHPSAYVSRGNSLGRRVKELLNLPPCIDGDKERFFPIPFIGRYVTENGSNRYSWKLRPELEKALNIIFEDEAVDDNKEFVPVKYETGYASTLPRNRILFGAPGTGKSFTINSEKKELLANGGDYERVTFHPDYTYANFVGTYKPVPSVDKAGNEVITYEYVPGPFMRTLVKALDNGRTESVEPYLLIVEEINRANVAAVFGDVFQLLDRVNNVSEYPIQASEDIKKYLAKELGGNPADYNAIQIPDNMFIWATMNSADQGVYPMDTAFKRRWDFTYLSINTNESQIKGHTVELGTGSDKRVVEWNKLRKAINNELVTYKINEDKLLGTFFIPKDKVPGGDNFTAEEFKRIFKNKVIMYLFDDAARQKAPSLFAGSKKKLYSEICEAFDIMGVNIFCDNIKNQFTVDED